MPANKPPQKGAAVANSNKDQAAQNSTKPTRTHSGLKKGWSKSNIGDKAIAGFGSGDIGNHVLRISFSFF